MGRRWIEHPLVDGKGLNVCRREGVEVSYTVTVRLVLAGLCSSATGGLKQQWNR